MKTLISNIPLANWTGVQVEVEAALGDTGARFDLYDYTWQISDIHREPGRFGFTGFTLKNDDSIEQRLVFDDAGLSVRSMVRRSVRWIGNHV